MELGLPINKYQLAMIFREKTVEWRFSVETEDGARHELAVPDGAEVPILLDMLRRDMTMYFDPQTRALSTGWNDPGE